MQNQFCIKYWLYRIEYQPKYLINLLSPHIGVDAQIALQFHEAREANPQKFNSRIRNKMFYGQAGGKDLLLRKWKDLSDNIKVECDGQDITPKLKEHRVHSVLFANIPSFGSGELFQEIFVKQRNF